MKSGLHYLQIFKVATFYQFSPIPSLYYLISWLGLLIMNTIQLFSTIEDAYYVDVS